MSSTQLGLYNAALRAVGERRLASLTENREPRRLLDEIWNDDAIEACLEMGQWKFACRISSLTYSPSIEPDFGYRYAFDKPADHIRTVAFCRDEYFKTPLIEYNQSANYWFCDLQAVYVQYVSSDSAYGGDLSLWPKSFDTLVAAFLARDLGRRMKNGSDQAVLKKEFDDALTEAKSLCAMEGPTQFPAAGSWVQSRSNGRFGRGNRC